MSVEDCKIHFLRKELPGSRMLHHADYSPWQEVGKAMLASLISGAPSIVGHPTKLFGAMGTQSPVRSQWKDLDRKASCWWVISWAKVSTLNGCFWIRCQPSLDFQGVSNGWETNSLCWTWEGCSTLQNVDGRPCGSVCLSVLRSVVINDFLYIVNGGRVCVLRSRELQEAVGSSRQLRHHLNC